MDGMANPGERSINIVIDNKPKVLEGLSQKGTVAGTRSLPFLVMGITRYRWIEAVTQKSPCEGNRVIMGEESTLKLSQRGPDAGQGGAHENPEAIIRPRAHDLST